ncbi:gluconate 2-dehydrogenase subunit 3 family protein [Rathayibacter caricis]|nr:gluconate 2-dehydrogenase subunit 3 family protein [Rathayibacter caricis]
MPSARPVTWSPMPSSDLAHPALFVVREQGSAVAGGLAPELEDVLDVVPLEPGDPDSAVQDVVRAVAFHGSTRWLIAGEGRGGEVAALVASRTLAGRSGLFGLAGLVLIGGAAGEVAGRIPTLRLDDATGAATAIRSFWVERAGIGPAVPVDASRAIASARTTTRVRALLAERLLADDPHYAPRVLTPSQLATLRAIADRVVPQEGGRIDLAARVDAQLADGQGDGWRNAALPADPIAYGLGLDSLDGFAALAPSEQDDRLSAVADGSAATGVLTPEQLTAWFEDCRVDLVRQWLAHPASMARVGYDGYASGGDTLPLAGFHSLGADQREDWEPTARSPR